MAWKLLPTDYTDAVWSGLKRYTQVDNSDGTVSFNDVTTYTNKEKSFFGAKDANRMNEALNYIMSMLENGTNLYEEFQTYFTTQKELFKSSGDSSYQELTQYFVNLKAQGDSSLAQIEKTYEEHMTTYEGEQTAAFNTWFAGIKGKLNEDIAGSLQNQITEVDERLAALEHMTLKNLFTVPVAIDNTCCSLCGLVSTLIWVLFSAPPIISVRPLCWLSVWSTLSQEYSANTAAPSWVACLPERTKKFATTLVWL